MGYRYSVIIPVYNSECTIERCLDSILENSGGNVEIVVVNDGSHDNSDSLIRSYVEHHENIVYVQKENGGVSSARNVGLDIARGEYVLFVDSDDYVLPRYFSALDEILDYQSVDFIVHAVPKQHRDKICYTNPFEIATFVAGLEYAGALASTTTKVFSKSIIDKLHLRFCEELVIGEDVVFTFAYALYVASAVALKECLYQVVLDNIESLSRKKRTYLCEQSLLMRRMMLQSLNNAHLPSEIHDTYYRMFGWSFYHGAYSVCKELLKFELSISECLTRIDGICRQFNKEGVSPCGIKCNLLALPIRLCLSPVIYLMAVVAAARVHKQNVN